MSNTVEKTEVYVVSYGAVPERPSRAKNGHQKWDGEKWPAYARAIRARGCCRTFPDFLLQIGLCALTSQRWRKMYPEWKAVCENFPQRSRVFQSNCIYQPVIARYEELTSAAINEGASECAAHWAAADQAIAERMRRNKERSTATRIAKNGGRDFVRPSKGRRLYPSKRRYLQKRTEHLFRHMQSWSLIQAICYLHGVSVAEALRNFTSRPDAMHYYMAASKEYHRWVSAPQNHLASRSGLRTWQDW